MKRPCVSRLLVGSLIVGLLTLATSLASTPTVTKKVGPDEKLWTSTVDKAVDYLKKSQANDGSFSKQLSFGVTGVVATGLLQTGRVSPDDPVAAKALRFLESLVNEKEGHLAGKDPKNQLKNYVTSVNVLAFAEADKLLAKSGKERRYKKVVDMAAHYLKELQWDEGEGKPPQDDFHGGAGYDSKSRPDLSNTQFFLDALKSAGLPENDPAFKKAAVFVSRCQNLKSEYNDSPWAKLINDGGFIYTAAGGGETKSDPLANGGLPSYGSMTYAGVKSMIYAGVSKDDKRVKAALEWIRKNYTLEENPGMPKSRSQQGMFYYYHTMAKCFDALGVDEFEDAKGIKHDWRKEITEELAKRQRPDGSWLNEQDRWMEGDANLVTAYALMTLSYCKPKK